MEQLSLKERMLIEAGFLPFKNSKKDGGPGSGNFGHEGRPGKVGGSSSSGHVEPVSVVSHLEDYEIRNIRSPMRSVIGGWGMKASCKKFMQKQGASEETLNAIDRLFNGHSNGGDWQKDCDKEIFKHINDGDAIGQALIARSQFETGCYEEWKKAHPDSYQLNKNGELRVYRKGDRTGEVECWTIDPDGADMGYGGIGVDHESTLEQLQREGYSVIAGFGLMGGAPGEGEITFVKTGKGEETAKSEKKNEQPSIPKQPAKCKNKISKDQQERYAKAPEGQKMLMNMSPEEVNEFVFNAETTDPDYGSENEKQALQCVLDKLGMNDKPKVVSAYDFGAEEWNSPVGTMYRGVVANEKMGMSAEDVVKNTLYGDKTIVGYGVETSGIYFAPDRREVELYAGNGKGKIMKACFSESTRLVDYEKLMELQAKSGIEDLAVCALYHGYNAVIADYGAGEEYMIALDRSTLVFEDPSKKDSAESQKTGISENISAAPEKPIDFSPENNTIKSKETSADGGPGSGNFGHEGRAGEVGGSMPNGGDAGLASMPMSKGAEVVNTFGVGTTVKITKKNGQKILFTKLGDNQWSRDDQPGKVYQDVGVAGNCWKSEVEVTAKKSEKPEERREISEGVEKAEEKAEKNAEETEAKEAPKPTGKYAQLSDKVDAVKKSDMTKAEKADAYKQMVKEAEPGTTFKCAGIEYRKTEDPDYPLAMIDFEGKAFRHVRDVDWDIEFSADKDDCIKFFDKDAIVAGRKETAAKMKESGKFSTSDQVHAERPGKITLNSENFGESGDYVVYRNGNIGSSGMIFFSPKKEGADSYSFAHGGSNTGEYEVHLDKPLVIRGETDVECIKKAYETLHPGKAVKGPMTSAKWISCDKANASALNSGTDGYDSVVYIINGKPSEVQVSAKKAKKSVKKTGEYTVAEWSKSGHTYEEAAARGYIDETAEDYKRVDSVDDGFGEDGVHCSQNKYDEILRRAND